jgi:DNA-binding response OmpR family regulator
MDGCRILIVDKDSREDRAELIGALQKQGCKVTTASDVPEALKYISSNVYDVLLSDLHMSGVGDGLTVVSAMRLTNPKAVTMVLSAFPQMNIASQSIMMQADQVLVKPLDVTSLIAAIQYNLEHGPRAPSATETVATILDRTKESTIADWYQHVMSDKKLTAVPLTYNERTSHLTKVIRDLVVRLRDFPDIGGHEITSPDAAEHGRNRRRQGYTAAMLVEESRMLQVSIFHTLQKNLANIDFSILLVEVMTIADEIDSQLSQAMTSFSKRSSPAKKSKISISAADTADQLVV